MAKISGGEALEAKLRELSQNVSNASSLRVGWPADKVYEDGTPVALVAAINEFGRPSHNQPPRPFLRNMIAQESPHWPALIATNLKLTNYDARATLNAVGPEIVGQVQDSILAFTDPPLAPSTIAKKGHDKPLEDTKLMLHSVTYEIVESEFAPVGATGGGSGGSPGGSSKGGGFFSRVVQKVKGWLGF